VEWASEERKAIPMHTEPAAVLAAVKDKPKRAAPRGGPSLTAAARGGPLSCRAGTEEWAAKPNKRMGNGKVKKHRC